MDGHVITRAGICHVGNGLRAGAKITTSVTVRDPLHVRMGGFPCQVMLFHRLVIGAQEEWIH